MNGDDKCIGDLRALGREHGRPIYATGKTEDQECEICGKYEELRPYGPNSENICYRCMMKDEPAAKRAFAKSLDKSREV